MVAYLESISQSISVSLVLLHMFPAYSHSLIHTQPWKIATVKSLSTEYWGTTHNRFFRLHGDPVNLKTLLITVYFALLCTDTAHPYLPTSFSIRLAARRMEVSKSGSKDDSKSRWPWRPLLSPQVLALLIHKTDRYSCLADLQVW